MTRYSLHLIALVFAAVPAWAQPGDQIDRRDRREPTIVLNTGGRTGTCDVAQFTPDGSNLLAVGDDKVVTDYPVGVKGLGRPNFHRWPTWREQRGSIFAMDISPDGRYVAIGGYGAKNTSVAVLDRTIEEADKNKIVRIVTLERGESDNFFAIMAIAYSPGGQQLAIGTGNGSVWMWNLKDQPELIGFHKPLEGTSFNRVRAIRFDNENTIRSIAENGKVARWTRTAAGWTGVLTHEMKIKDPCRAARFSPTGWLATAELGPLVRVVSPDGAIDQRIEFRVNEFPRSIAFSSDGSRLAVGVGRLNEGTPFPVEGNDEIRLYNVTEKGVKADNVLPHTGKADALAWSGTRLGVAGGDNQEVTLWDAARRERIGRPARGVGAGLWGVALTADENHLAFYESRDPAARHPNHRSAGTPRYFRLAARKFQDKAPDVRTVPPLEEYEGWTLQPTNLPWQWNLVRAGQAPIPLPWDRDQDERPTCFTFLKPVVAGGPVRLAVGHYWGFSLFEIRDGRPKRVRLFTGHEAPVTAIGPSERGDWLVTSSSDQTIAAWSLTNWPSGTVTGATFTPLPTSVHVNIVDKASPAWEMGLLPDDEIVELGVGGKWFFKSGRLGDPVQAKAALDNAEPGRELLIVVRRTGGQKKTLLSTVRTRPLWRLFPASNRDMVMWMWHGSFYDTSTSGDTLVGWSINDPTLSKSPQFFLLQQYDKVFHRADVIRDLVKNRDVGKALQLALQNNPVPPLSRIDPELDLELSSPRADQTVTAHLAVKARSDNVDYLPDRIELWINDFRAGEWKPKGRVFELDFAIDPKSMLRSGQNTVVLQSFNNAGGRSDCKRIVTKPDAPASRKLLGLGVGIDNYGAAAAAGGGRAVGDLNGAVNDVNLHAVTWSTQPKGKGKLFDDVAFLPLTTPRPGAANKSVKPATRQQIVAEFARLKDIAEPDDLLLVVLAGHGVNKKTAVAGGAAEDEFLFCCPNFDPQHPEETALSHTELANMLARIRCRKVIFLDACHSGVAAFDGARCLTPGGQGATIFAACERNEQAYENEEKHNGIFTLAILHALGDGFAKTDANKDGDVDAAELFEAICREVPVQLRAAKKDEDLQHPTCYPRQPDATLRLFRK